MKKLTSKQDMFVREYLIDLNATQAAIRAGYSEKTADVIGHENLGKPYIQSAIQEEMNKRASKVAITADDVLKDIIATRTTCEEYMVVDGELSPSAVNGRNKTNEMLGKHLKLFTDKVELEVTKMPSINLKRSE